MSRPRAFVEAPAGLASVSLRLHGGAHCRPPISRMGNKAGYAEVILAALGLRSGEGAGAYVWAESDPDVRALLRAYPDADTLRRIADIIRGWKDEEPRALWERLRAERKARGPAVEPTVVDASAWIYSAANSFRAGFPDSGIFVNAAGSSDPDDYRRVSAAGVADTCHRLAEYASNEVASGFERVAGWLTAGSLTHGGLDVRGPQRWSFNTGFESGETFARGPEGVAEDCHRLAEYASIVASNRLIHVAGPDLRNTGAGGTTFGGEAFVTPAAEVASGFERVAGWTYLGATGFVGGDADSAYAGDPGDGPGFSGRAGDPRLRIGGRLDAIASRWPPVAVLPTLPDAATLSALLGTPGDLDGVVVYSDPDYRDTTGYLSTCREMIPALARGWSDAGAVVCISEAEPLPELPGWFATEISAGRRGQKRTFSKQQAEWLTMNREPAHRVAVQVSMFGATR